MTYLFLTYRGFDRSRVKETESYIKKNGLCHDFKDDIDEGDLRNYNDSYIWDKIKSKMATCSGQVILLGDTSHSPGRFFKKEYLYAMNKNWYILGIKMSHSAGSIPSDIKNYDKYVEISYNFPTIVSEITKRIPCD